MHPTRRQLLHTLAATTALGGAGRAAWAQQHPEQFRVVNGFAPGGTADVVSRRVADKLHPVYAASAIVDNRTGAGGQIAVQFVKNAAPDGTTALLTPMSMLGIYPHTYKRLPYDPVADLAPVSTGAIFDYGFAVGPAVPDSVKTMPQFLAWCKANPAKASFGSPAAGSSPHFIGVLLGKAAGVELVHVPYRGTQPALLDMVAGQIPAVSGPVGEFIQYVQAGKCRLLATSGAKRNRFVTDVPTLVEQGYKDMALNEWFGFFLPAKTPAEIVQRLNAAIRTALAQPYVVEGLAAVGLEAQACSPQELAAMLRADTERWRAIVKKVGFTAEN